MNRPLSKVREFLRSSSLLRMVLRLSLGLLILVPLAGDRGAIGRPGEGGAVTYPTRVFGVSGRVVTLEEMSRFHAVLPPVEAEEVPNAEIPDPLLIRSVRSGVQEPVRPRPGAVAWPGPPPPQPESPPLPEAPPLSNNFPGMIDNNTFIPPDTMGAAGPTHLVSVLNRGFAIYNKTTGALVSGPISLQSFWAALGTGPGQPAQAPFDPKILYDQFSGRFIVVSDGTQNVSGSSWLLVAVSLASDPTAGFRLYAIDVDATSPGLYADYTGLGVDQRAVYITNNLFSVAPTPVLSGTKYWVIDKASLLSGGSLFISEFSNGTNYGSTWQPTHAFGSTPVSYIINQGWSDTSTGPTSRYLFIRQFSFPGSSPVLTDLGFVRVGDYGYDPLQDAPQPGCSERINTFSLRLMNAVLRNGRIWTTHQVDDPVTDGVGKTEVAWYEIDPAVADPCTVSCPSTAVPAQQGRVRHPSTWYYFPSIAVNNSGCVALGFSGSDSSTYASAYYTGRRPSNPPGTMQTPALLKAGVSPYLKKFGDTRNRWGDYSATSIDPANGETFWTIQEYAEPQVGAGCPTANTGVWGTWWGSFGCGCSSNADCTDGQVCNGTETCDVPTSTCLPGTPPSCDDGNACTADSCSTGLNACVNTPLPDSDGDGVCDIRDNCVATFNPDQTDTEADGTGEACDCAPFEPGGPIPGTVGNETVTHDRLSGLSTLGWSAIPSGYHYNTYRGTVPPGGMASRGGGAYDHVCFERGDASANGERVSVDGSAPATGAAFYYLIDGTNGCGEGSLGQASNGSSRPNPSPCVTPPTPPGSINGRIVGDVTDSHSVSLALTALSGREVELFRGGFLAATTFTDGGGYYAFTGLGQGVYDVRAVAPDLRTATTSAPVTGGANVTINFIVVPRKPQGIFASYAGIAIDQTTTRDPDLDRSGLVDLVDISRVVQNIGFSPAINDGDFNVDGQIDYADLAPVTSALGRAVLEVPALYQIQVTDGGTLVNIDSGSTIVHTTGGETTGQMLATGNPSQIVYQVTHFSGGLTSPELGPFNYQEVPGDPSYLTIDLNTNRVLGGRFSKRLSGGLFTTPCDVGNPVPDGFVAFAPGGFSLNHLVGVTGTLPSTFPIYAGTTYFLGKCDPPKANVDCVTRKAVAGDKGINPITGMLPCNAGIDDVCAAPGAACAAGGKCGECETWAAGLKGNTSCACWCKR